MILDLSTNLPEEFDKEKQFAIDLIRQSAVNDYMNRTRVALVTFSELGKLEFGLTTTTAQDDLLYALERIERTGGQTSVVNGWFLYGFVEIFVETVNGTFLLS
jgi:hypothetical protein